MTHRFESVHSDCKSRSSVEKHSLAIPGIGYNFAKRYHCFIAPSLTWDISWILLLLNWLIYYFVCTQLFFHFYTLCFTKTFSTSEKKIEVSVTVAGTISNCHPTHSFALNNMYLLHCTELIAVLFKFLVLFTLFYFMYVTVLLAYIPVYHM